MSSLRIELTSALGNSGKDHLCWHRVAPRIESLPIAVLISYVNRLKMQKQEAVENISRLWKGMVYVMKSTSGWVALHFIKATEISMWPSWGRHSWAMRFPLCVVGRGMGKRGRTRHSTVLWEVSRFMVVSTGHKIVFIHLSYALNKPTWF